MDNLASLRRVERIGSLKNLSSGIFYSCVPFAPFTPNNYYYPPLACMSTAALERQIRPIYGQRPIIIDFVKFIPHI